MHRFRIIAAVVAAVFWLPGCESGGQGDAPGKPLETQAAVKALKEWTQKIRVQDLPVQANEPALARETTLEAMLPSIETFPLTVEVPATGGAAAVEIFASTEKSGSGSDGWMVEVAKRFNDANLRLTGGKLARVAIRKIASGTAYEFIATRKYVPDAFSPSSQLWGEMVKAHGVRVTRVHTALADNVAGIVMKRATAAKKWPGRTAIGVGDVVDASIRGAISLGYTNPFASSTGLNLLVTMLQVFSQGKEGELLSPEVASSFEAFQKNVPFVAMTTLQMRDSVERDGSLDAFVMEHQTFSQTASLRSGYEFIPFGFRHDNPLYAVGNLAPEKREVLERFAAFCLEEPQRKLAAEYGFYPPVDWKEPYPIPAGKTLIAVQKLWKQKKDAGRPIAAVFVADVSGSMAGSKIMLLRKALLDGSQFISSGNAIGLLAFSSEISVLLAVKPFSLLHKAAFQAGARRLEAGGNTAMYDAVAVALSMLHDYRQDHPEVRPMVFVLTDGETNTGATYEKAAPIIAGLKVPVYTIGFDVKVKELSRLSSLVEAANIDANEQDLRYKIGALFNAQM